MRKVKRWRYYCDFCKKSGGSGGHMARHEKGCTLNPNRTCNVCAKLLEVDQKPMSELLSVLPNGTEYITEDAFGFSYNGLQEIIDDHMPKLRELTENCPACIMAALRQSGIPVPMVESFDFTKEMDSIWADINANDRDDYYAQMSY